MSDQVTARGKYWIKPGAFVTKYPDDTVMVVMRVLQERDRLPDGTFESRIQGVKCKWEDDNGEQRTGIFRTTDLVPA